MLLLLCKLFGYTYYMKNYIIAILFLSCLITNGQTIMIKHTSYEICFDTILRQPKWTHYVLSKDKLANLTKRTVFQTDTMIAQNKQGSINDYRRTSYDRGHLAPNNDFRYNSIAQYENMLYTNCVPQNKVLNRGLWRSLEAYIDRLALSHTIDVWTGCIYTNSTQRAGKLLVPKYFWKLIKYNNMYEAYIIENAPPKRQRQNYLVTSDKVLILINK